VRELKLLGIDVYFEKENIYSMSGDGELMLSILASYAQDESLSASENAKWRFRNMFKDGKPSSAIIMGYRLVNGTFVIIPDEAEIVRMIFTDYLDGMGKIAIMKKLIALGIPTKHGGNWSEGGVHTMLRNEKYKGDLLLQKFYSSDHISKKKRTNKGELPSYYVEDSHEPIIDKETFQRVQNELARRSALYRQPKEPLEPYSFTGKIICGKCGKNYRRKIASAGTPYAKPVWICGTFNTRGKGACWSRQIPETILLEIAGADFEKIRVTGANTLTITMADGSESERQWQYKSRSESWTDEKREAARARQREIERSKNNAAKKD
jgi:hypothetical protein